MPTMRIIIVQSEIEEAIKAYVLNQIAVREGQEVTIDFKATRGDDGMTAEVNIGSVAGNEKPAEKPVQSVSTAQATKAAAKTASASPAPAAAATKPIVSEPAASVASASTTTAQPETTTETSEATATAETSNQEEEGQSSGFPAKTVPYDEGREEAIAAQEAEAAKVVPVSKPSFLNAQPAASPADAVPASGKSLFANLTKPVNPKPAEG